MNQDDEISLLDGIQEKKEAPKPAPVPAQAPPAAPGEETAAAPEAPKPSSLTGGPKLTCAETERSITTGVTTTYDVILENRGDRKDDIRLALNIIYTPEGGAAEWTIEIVNDESKDVWEVTHTRQMTRDYGLEVNKGRKLSVNITAPRGASYADTVRLVMTASSVTDPAISDSITLKTTAKQSILFVKTQIGQERTVAESLFTRGAPVGVLAVMNPHNLRGYLVIEAMNTDRLVEAIKSVRKSHGLVKGEASMADIATYLAPKPVITGIVEGDIVELISGPFKGEKARVRHIDEGKEEITVELFEALVPMPVTVRGDSVRLLEKEV
jgi:transcriptional antiterminator NusG